MDARNGISKATRALLGSEESSTLDFKETVESLKIDDLCAFANAAGGTILLGVSRRTEVSDIVGCPWDDKAELSIRQKAGEADPPVSITLYAENTGSVPFVRVEIPQSPTRPHCTPGGVFKIRDGNKNRPVKSSELLTMFLEAQSRQFVERFREAAADLYMQLHDLDMNIDRFAQHIESNLGDVQSNVDEAFTAADESRQVLDEIESDVEKLQEGMEFTNIVLVQVVEALKLDHPEKFKQRRSARGIGYLAKGVSSGDEKRDAPAFAAKLIQKHRAEFDRLSDSELHEAVEMGLAQRIAEDANKQAAVAEYSPRQRPRRSAKKK